MRCGLTLSVPVCLSVQGKLARVIQHHELLQKALDDLPDCGGRADVQLLHAVTWQVERCPLVTQP